MPLPSGKLLGIDYGTRRMGLAISDAGGTFAFPHSTVAVGKKNDGVAEIAALCREESVQGVIVGLPRHMNGDEGIKAAEAREFAARLEAATGLSIILFDERLTSKLAEQTLRAQGVQFSKKRELVDQLAAQRILQDYLDAESFRKARGEN